MPENDRRTVAGGANHEAKFLVRGSVLNSDGSPMDDVVVRAFDVDFRSETLLGEARPRGGYYEITYRIQDFARAERKRLT